ncbi:ankyrin repeat domain-containing protein 26-like [Ochotona princeps]|uniref:ankyrin repeat domain-containing protein 26-like n=1 Tax=Ochotona princeps TaxID=9978 RepID=UPI002714EA19|nr:ankyrin repeat domain-containing protein 26-like [Ochotona princeps]
MNGRDQSRLSRKPHPSDPWPTPEVKDCDFDVKEQASSQEKLQNSGEATNASVRNQLEFRIKELESELSKMKAAQKDSNRREMEKYKQLYLEEVEIRRILSNKLNESTVMLAEVRTKLLLEKLRNRCLLNTLTGRPLLESGCVGNVNNTLELNRHLISQENLMIPISRQQISHNSMVIKNVDWWLWILSAHRVLSRGQGGYNVVQSKHGSIEAVFQASKSMLISQLRALCKGDKKY